MPLRMFHLRPGYGLRYRVRPVSGDPRPELRLDVCRPDEGPSMQLELELRQEDETLRGRVRVDLDRGYLGVVRELEGLLAGVDGWSHESLFDLVRLPGVRTAWAERR